MPTDNPELLASIRGPNIYPVVFSHYDTEYSQNCNEARNNDLRLRGRAHPPKMGTLAESHGLT